MGTQTTTSWKPGVSGNPKGPPKGTKRLSPKQYLDIKAQARKHGPDAVAILARIMRNKKAPVTARITAAGMLLDRGYGRPAQKIDIQAIMGAIDLTRLTDAQLEQMEQLIGQAAGTPVERLPVIDVEAIEVEDDGLVVESEAEERSAISSSQVLDNVGD